MLQKANTVNRVNSPINFVSMPVAVSYKDTNRYLNKQNMKSIILKSVLLLIFLFFLSGIGSAQVGFYEKKLFVSKKDTLRYLSLKNQKGNGKVPLILYLHSADANGRDNEKQLTHSPGIVTDPGFKDRHGYYFIAPQCAPNKSWVNANNWNRYKMTKTASSQMQLVKALVDSIIMTNKIDEKRIYVIGASMGGFGTWDLICRYPSMFAAAIPVCGIGDINMAKYIINIPIWVFHGEKDARVKVQYSRDIVKAIKNAGGNPRYTEYPGLPHDIRDTVYNNPGVWDWMFLQKLK
jgi:predicted peptidase